MPGVPEHNHSTFSCRHFRPPPLQLWLSQSNVSCLIVIGKQCFRSMFIPTQAVCEIKHPPRVPGRDTHPWIQASGHESLDMIIKKKKKRQRKETNSLWPYCEFVGISTTKAILVI